MIEIKTCIKCKIEKPLSEYYGGAKGSRVGARRTVCKICWRLQSAQWKEERLRFVKDYKQNNPCMDCGKYYHYYAMDFDHVRGEKIKDISDMWAQKIERIKAEIEKCDLVCATCHRLRTWKRKEYLSKKALEVLNG